MSSPAFEDTPHGNLPGAPAETAALKRLHYLQDVELIERCAAEAGGGGWKLALIDNCCRCKRYDAIDPRILPTSNRTEFFKARRHFFWLLNEKRHTM